MKFVKVVFVFLVLMFSFLSVSAAELRQCSSIDARSETIIGDCQHEGHVYSYRKTIGISGTFHPLTIEERFNTKITVDINQEIPDEYKGVKVEYVVAEENGQRVEYEVNSAGGITGLKLTDKYREDVAAAQSQSQTEDSSGSGEAATEKESETKEVEKKEEKPKEAIPGELFTNPVDNLDACGERLNCHFKCSSGEDKVCKTFSREGIRGYGPVGVGGEVSEEINNDNLAARIRLWKDLEEDKKNTYVAESELDKLAAAIVRGEGIPLKLKNVQIGEGDSAESFQILDYDEEVLKTIFRESGRAEGLDTKFNKENALLSMAILHKKAVAEKNEDGEINWRSVCSGIGSRCITTLVEIKELDLAVELIESGEIPVNEETITEIVGSENEFSEKDRQALVDAYNDNKCDGILGWLGCKIRGKVNLNKIFDESFEKAIANIDTENSNTKTNDIRVVTVDILPQVAKKDEGKKTKVCEEGKSEDCVTPVCREGTSYNECFGKIKSMCEGKESDECEHLRSQLGADAIGFNNDEKAINSYNRKIIEELIKQSSICVDRDPDYCANPILEACKDISSKECREIVENPIVCGEKKEDCSLFLRGLETAKKEQLVQTNIVFDVLAIVNNADYSALKASRYFGFEDKFSLVDEDSILGSAGFSNICLYKIDGYIDKERSDAEGGVTKYEFTNTSAERELVVRYDLRAQRTPITPDDSVSITYSYFLRAPDRNNLDYLVALFYRQNGEIKKLALTELLNVKAGEVVSEFDNVNVFLNETDGIEPESFRIKLRANFENSTTKFFQAEAPVILIGQGDQFAAQVANLNIGNSQGNEVATNQETQEQETFDENDMLDLMGG